MEVTAPDNPAARAHGTVSPSDQDNRVVTGISPVTPFFNLTSPASSAPSSFPPWSSAFLSFPAGRNRNRKFPSWPTGSPPFHPIPGFFRFYQPRAPASADAPSGEIPREANLLHRLFRHPDDPLLA